MQTYLVNTNESFNDFLSCLQDGVDVKRISDNTVKIDSAYLEFTKEYQDRLDLHDIINGVNKETNIVSIAVDSTESLAYIFKETDKGVSHHTVPYRHWLLAKSKPNDSFQVLNGSAPFKFYKDYDAQEFLIAVRPKIYGPNFYTIRHLTENFMVKNGHTYYKGMRSKDVSMLSFDIETTGLDPNVCELLVITNTYRKNDNYVSKTFILNDYSDEADMIEAWCKWVTDMDPSILLGHNIVMFDIPFINARWNKVIQTLLPLGRLGYGLEIEDRPRELRKDGSQTYTYHRINCFGREIVDTFFMSIKADIARKYESYGLKAIIKQEGLEEEGRIHYDASKIKANWKDPEELKKIVAYAEADSRDPIKLFDLMSAPFFYLTPHIPKPFQVMVESATGSQINALMVRSYLQKGMSVAEASNSEEFEGAISFGNTGIYDNVFKVDVSSLYPSVMRQYKIFPEGKDYNNHFLKMLEFFTVERLKNKKLAKDTGDRFYDDLQNSQKVVINSAYGFMGARGLNYNYPKGAADVTRYGRDIITKSCIWATGHTLKKAVKKIVNEGKENQEIQYHWVMGDKVAEGKGYIISNCDTDSISFTCGKDLTKDDRAAILSDLNSNFPAGIRFDDDGYYPRIIILKAKNYIMYDGKKIKLKGSSIRDQKKEAALKEMMDKMIDCLVFDKPDNVIGIYESFIKEAYRPTDIKRWSAKKTVTKAILNCANDSEARANERKVYDAVKDLPGLQEGDKVYLYPCILNTEMVESRVLKDGTIKYKEVKTLGLKTAEAWNKDHDVDKLIERVVDTVDIFSNIIDTERFINYSLVKNKKNLTELVS